MSTNEDSMNNQGFSHHESQQEGEPYDSYAEFMKIASAIVPPNHYELLGVELFCPHREQIQRAAQNRFRGIKAFEEHADRAIREAVQEVMTRIAGANIVLTDPESKQEYDDKLARELGIDRDRILLMNPASRAPEYQLTVIAGPSRVGSRLELLPDRQIAVGSDPRCHLCLPSLRMKRSHFGLTFSDDNWTLRARDASSVLLVNDCRCNEHTLSPNDSVDAGGYRLRFDSVGELGPSPRSLPPPMSLIIRSGPSVPDPIINALPPTSILIGHCDTALWQLSCHTVSRHHARVVTRNGIWEIEDLQSRNGVYVNDEQVHVSPLRHRDNVTIGHFNIQVSLRR